MCYKLGRPATGCEKIESLKIDEKTSEILFSVLNTVQPPQKGSSTSRIYSKLSVALRDNQFIMYFLRSPEIPPVKIATCVKKLRHPRSVHTVCVWLCVAWIQQFRSNIATKIQSCLNRQKWNDRGIQFTCFRCTWLQHKCKCFVKRRPNRSSFVFLLKIFGKRAIAYWKKHS